MATEDENYIPAHSEVENPEADVPKDKMGLIRSIHEMRVQLSEEIAQAEDKKDEASVVHLQTRLRLLNRSALPLYRASDTDFMKSVFISYVKNNGTKVHFDEACRRFANARYDVASGLPVEVEERADGTFEIRTGFERQREAQIVDNIADLIGRSSAFLGLWTFPVEATVAHPPPGHWLPLELGMAVALRKPFRIVVDSRIDSDWYLKPLRGIIHTVYEVGAPPGPPKDGRLPSFSWAIEEARIALDQRLEEKLYESTGADIADDLYT